MNVGAMSMNPGGIIGVLLGLGIPAWMSISSGGDGVHPGVYLFVVIGAIGGNFLWRFIFPKKE